MDGAQIRYSISEFQEALGMSIEGIADLFENYFKEMAIEIRKMHEYLAEGDWYMLQRVVHAIKGVSANLRVHDVYEGAVELDDNLKKKSYEDVPKYVENIEKMILNAEAEVRAYFLSKGIRI